MPPQLLPASAAAFAPRASSVNVVLGSKVEPWLTQTLKRINRIKRPLNSAPQHHKCLTETLSSTNAIWTLTSIMLSKAPDSELRKDSDPLIEAMFNFQLVHIEAYIVHVDMVLRNEVAFKLTPDSIEALIDYHKEIHCVDIAASTYNWLGKELQVMRLHEEFIQAINKFVYKTNVTALEGLEEEGAGELLCGKSKEVKNNIMNMFLPLSPPPRRVVDVIKPRRPFFLVQQRSPQDLLHCSQGPILEDTYIIYYVPLWPTPPICPPRSLVPALFSLSTTTSFPPQRQSADCVLPSLLPPPPMAQVEVCEDAAGRENFDWEEAARAFAGPGGGFDLR